MIESTLVRLKNLATINDDQLDENTDPDYVFEYVDVGSVGRGYLVDQPDKVSFADAPTRARRLVLTGDAIVSTVRTYLRAILPIGPELSDVVVSTGFAVVRPRSTIDPWFLAWSLQGDPFVEQVVARSTGVSYPAIAPSTMADITLTVPVDRKDQKLIADFLDRETHRIDALVDTKRRMIDLLEEKRRSAVAARLPGPTENYPAHWSRLMLRRLRIDLQTGPFGSQLHSSDYVVGGVPILNATHLNGGRIQPDDSVTADEATVRRLAQHKLKEGDLIFGRRGEAARVALVSSTEHGWLCGTGSIRLRVKDRRVAPRFLLHYFSSPGLQSYYESLGSRSTMLNLNEDMLRATPVPLPSKDEQDEIVSSIDRTSQHVRELQSKLQRQLHLLTEYRQALITQAVTGQLDEATLKGDKPIDEAVGVIPE